MCGVGSLALCALARKQKQKWCNWNCSSFKLVKRCGSQNWKSEGLAGQALVKDSERTGSWRFKHGLEVEEDGHRPRLARGLGMEYL